MDTTRLHTLRTMLAFPLPLCALLGAGCAPDGGADETGAILEDDSHEAPDDERVREAGSALIPATLGHEHKRRTCRAAEVGSEWTLAAGYAGGDEYAARRNYAQWAIDKGCRFFRWPGTTWAQPAGKFMYGDTYWSRAYEFNKTTVSRAQGTVLSNPVSSFHLSEIVSLSRYPTSLGYTWQDAAPQKCGTGGGNAMEKDIPFRYYYPTQNLVALGTPPTRCNVTGTCFPDPSCSLAAVGGYHYNPGVQNTQSVPSVIEEATKAWWEEIADLAYWNGFHDVTFSMANRTANLDYPNYTHLKQMRDRILANTPGMSFGVWDGRLKGPGSHPVPGVIGETHYKNIGKLHGTSLQNGVYRYHAACYQHDAPGMNTPAPGASDLCMTATTFDAEPGATANPIVELDGLERWEVLSLPYHARRRFIEHGMKSAKKTWGAPVRGYFEVPMFGNMPVPTQGLAEQAVAGGWTYTYNGVGICRNAAGQPAVFPVQGIYDAALCGYDDIPNTIGW